MNLQLQREPGNSNSMFIQVGFILLNLLFFHAEECLGQRVESKSTALLVWTWIKDCLEKHRFKSAKMPRQKMRGYLWRKNKIEIKSEKVKHMSNICFSISYANQKKNRNSISLSFKILLQSALSDLYKIYNTHINIFNSTMQQIRCLYRSSGM